MRVKLPVTFLTLGLLSAAANAAGQSSVPATEGETITLSPFVVVTTQDRGYQSTNTQAGARIAVPIRELPLPISVLNRDLIDDLAITDLFQASRMATGGEFRNDPTNDTSFQFRGITSTRQTRNYFIWYLPTDAYNMERIEVLRGPLGVLYGDATPGGILNISTKQADLKRDFNRVVFRVDDNGSVRTTLDVNRAVSERAAVRFNAVYNDGESWKDFLFNKTLAAHLAGTFNLGKTTTLRVEGEYGDIERNNAGNVLTDQYSGVNLTGGTVAPVNGARNLLLADGTLYLNNNTATGMRRSQGTGRFITDPNALNGLADRVRTWGGPSARENRVYRQYAAYLEQRLGSKVTAEFAYNVQDQDNSITRATLFNNVRVVPTGAVTLNETLVAGNAVTRNPNPDAGRYYVEQEWKRQLVSNLVQDYRATVAYTFDLFKFTTQRIVGTIGYRDEEFQSLGYNETLRPDASLIAGGGSTAGNTLVNNAVTRRYYLDTDYSRLAFAPTAKTQWSPVDFAQDQLQKLRYTSIAIPGSFRVAGRDRVFTLVGFRRDHFTMDGIGGAALFPNNLRDAFGNLASNGIYGRVIDVKRESRNAGLVVEALPGFSLYVNKGESFRPIPQVRVDRTPIGAEDGDGIEYGLKAAFLGGRISGTVSFYDIENNNGSTNLGAPIAAELGTAATAGVISAPPGGFNATDSQDLQSDGYEIEIQANLVDGWTATLNYSKNDTVVTNVAPGLRRLRDQLTAAGYTGATTQIDNFLNAIVDPTPNRGVRPEAFNFFTRYNFKNDRLKGAYVGAGAQWRSKTLIDYGVPAGTPNNPAAIAAARQYYYLGDYTTVNALIGYRFNPRKDVSVNVALNVENLFDEEYINAFAAGFGQWGNPRTFVLTTTVNF